MAIQKKVKSKVIGGGIHPVTIAAVDETFLGIIDAWQPQDDIRIIGVEVGIEFDTRAPNFALACEVKGIVELTRAATIESDGRILAVELQHIWATTAITVFDFRKQLVMMFPEGYGMDVDSGSSINLAAYFYKSTNQSYVFFGTGTIFYVER